MKVIIFAKLPNSKVAKMVCFTISEMKNYISICEKHNYLWWYKEYNSHEEIEKELLEG